MTWATPKTNWLVDDAASTQDFNRWESNSDHLKTKTVHMCGGWKTDGLSGGPSDPILQRLFIKVPRAARLIIERINSSILSSASVFTLHSTAGGTSLNYYLIVDGEETQNCDYSPDHLIYTNSTAAPVGVLLELKLENSASKSVCGWAIRLGIHPAV